MPMSGGKPGRFMSLINNRLWRTPTHFWRIPTPPGRSPTPHPFAKSHKTPCATALRAREQDILAASRGCRQDRCSIGMSPRRLRSVGLWARTESLGGIGIQFGPDVSVALQQRANISSQFGKVGLQRLPYQLVINVGVLVDDYVAERKDATVPADTVDRNLIDPRDLAYRFTDDG